MLLSTDLPCGPKAIAAYLASGQSLRTNVSVDADRAFCLALKNSRRKERWQNLEQAMERNFYRARKAA